jgi:hypothetical protein
VPGRARCPELPPPPSQPAPNMTQRDVLVEGNNLGVIGDGNTVTYHGPVHYGSGHIVNAGRDAHVSFGGRP